MTGWALMVLAMMLPLLNQQIRQVAMATPRYRRQQAIAFFLLGYVMLWNALGMVTLALRHDMTSRFNISHPAIMPLLGALLFALAAVQVWQPSRRRILVACSRTMPLRISGWIANLDCLRYGFMTGQSCVRTCWLPMTALVLAGHDLPAMVAVAALQALERYRLPHSSKLPGYAWGLLALFFAGLALTRR